MIVRTRTRCVVEVALALLVSASVISSTAAQSRRAMIIDTDHKAASLGAMVADWSSEYAIGFQP